MNALKDKLGDCEFAHEQSVLANSTMKLAAVRENIIKRDKNAWSKLIDSHHEGPQISGDGLSAKYSKIRMYLKVKRKKLKDLERKDRLIVKLRKDFAEREKEYCEEISQLQNRLGLETEKYAKIEKMNSILNLEVKNLGGEERFRVDYGGL